MITSFALTYMRTFSFQPHNQWAGYMSYQCSPVSQIEAQRDQGTCTSQGSMGSFCLSILSTMLSLVLTLHSCLEMAKGCVIDG